MILPIRTFPRPFTIEQKDTAQRKPRITIVWWYKWEMLATRLKSSVQEAHFTTQFRCSNRGCKVQHISWRAVMSHSVQCTMILLASCMRTKETELNCSQIWDFLLCALIFARLAPTASQSPSTQLQFSGVHMLPCSGMGTLYCHMQEETKHRLLRFRNILIGQKQMGPFWHIWWLLPANHIVLPIEREKLSLIARKIEIFAFFLGLSHAALCLEHNSNFWVCLGNAAKKSVSSDDRWIFINIWSKESQYSCRKLLSASDLDFTE